MKRVNRQPTLVKNRKSQSRPKGKRRRLPLSPTSWEVSVLEHSSGGISSRTAGSIIERRKCKFDVSQRRIVTGLSCDGTKLGPYFSGRDPVRTIDPFVPPVLWPHRYGDKRRTGIKSLGGRGGRDRWLSHAAPFSYSPSCFSSDVRAQCLACKDFAQGIGRVWKPTRPALTPHRLIAGWIFSTAFSYTVSTLTLRSSVLGSLLISTSGR